MGQLAYATPELLAAHGLREDDRAPRRLLACPPSRLLLGVPGMAAAFREGGRGRAELEELERRPFDPALGSAHALAPARRAACRGGGGGGATWCRLALLVLAREARVSARMAGFHVMR